MFKIKQVLASVTLCALVSTPAVSQALLTNAVDRRLSDLASEVTYRIVGGTPAMERAWPWQVVLYRKMPAGDFRMSCGGSIVNERWVLTAAHCIGSLQQRDYAVIEATNRIDPTLSTKARGRLLEVKKVIPHQSYSRASQENDIALLELATPAVSTPIRLAVDPSLEDPGTVGTVTGWGTLRAIKNGQDALTQETVRPNDPRYFTDRLMEVNLPIVNLASCKAVYAGGASNIDNRVICAGFPDGGKDSCQGDSGGPFVVKARDGHYVQIGVVSFGKSCGLRETPGVYSRVSAFNDWIRTTTRLDLVRPPPPSALSTSAPLPRPPVSPPSQPVIHSPSAQGAAPSSSVQVPSTPAGQSPAPHPPVSAGPEISSPQSGRPPSPAAPPPPSLEVSEEAPPAPPSSVDQGSESAPVQPSSQPVQAQVDPAPPVAESPWVQQPPATPSASNNAAGLKIGIAQGDELRVGKSVQFEVSTKSPGYLVLVDITPDGSMRQIFPNARSLSTPAANRVKLNFIGPDRSVLIPNLTNPYEGFEMVSELPVGEGLLVAILSSEPLQSIQIPDEPITLGRPDALEYFAKITDELARDIEVSGQARVRDWSFAIKSYRIVQ